MNAVVALGCEITYVGDDIVIQEWLSRTWRHDTTERAPQPWSIQISHLEDSDRSASSLAAPTRDGHRGIRFVADGDDAFWAIAPSRSSRNLQ